MKTEDTTACSPPDDSLPSSQAFCLLTRPLTSRSRSAAVLFAGREDGVLEVWDLLDRSHEPSLLAAPSAAAITSLAFTPASVGSAAGAASMRAAQQLLAVGARACLAREHTQMQRQHAILQPQ